MTLLRTFDKELVEALMRVSQSAKDTGGMFHGSLPQVGASFEILGTQIEMAIAPLLSNQLGLIMARKGPVAQLLTELERVEALYHKAEMHEANNTSGPRLFGQDRIDMLSAPVSGPSEGFVDALFAPYSDCTLTHYESNRERLRALSIKLFRGEDGTLQPWRKRYRDYNTKALVDGELPLHGEPTGVVQCSPSHVTVHLRFRSGGGSQACARFLLTDRHASLQHIRVYDALEDVEWTTQDTCWLEGYPVGWRLDVTLNEAGWEAAPGLTDEQWHAAWEQLQTDEPLPAEAVEGKVPYYHRSSYFDRYVETWLPSPNDPTQLIRVGTGKFKTHTDRTLYIRVADGAMPMASLTPGLHSDDELWFPIPFDTLPWVLEMIRRERREFLFYLAQKNQKAEALDDDLSEDE